jgi:hypothetical protein
LERQKLGVSCSEDDDDISMKGTTQHVDPSSVAFVLVMTMFIIPIMFIHRSSKGTYYWKPLLSKDCMKTAGWEDLACAVTIYSYILYILQFNNQSKHCVMTLSMACSLVMFLFSLIYISYS